MTPEDVAAIRAYAAEHHGMYSTGIPVEALCDALTAAWAERDKMRHACQNLLGCPAPMWRERAERAEAGCAAWQALYYERSRALARVRALCDEFASKPEFIGIAVVVRAAIEGDNQ